MFEEIIEPKNPSDEQASVTNKVRRQPSNVIKNPPGTMVRKNMESVELDEVLTKSTTAGETIHDFVHSKNKMFAGDSKAQRIKRALGAYYKKQNEEVDADMTEAKTKKKKTINPGGSMPTTTNTKMSYSYKDMTEGWKEKVGAAALAGAMATGAGAKTQKVPLNRAIDNATIVYNNNKFIKKEIEKHKEKASDKQVKNEGVAEGWAVDSTILSDDKKDTRSASEKMSDYATKRHKVYQNIADKQKEHIKKWNEDHKDEPHLQIPVKEDIQQDSQAATQTVFDMGNNTDDTSQTFNRVKRAMKKKHVKEDTYDWEKADKSVASPGKKPKMDKSNEKTGEATTKPKAAAVLSGGTTMTGAPRDTIEIDPSMRNRPGQDGGIPSGKRKEG